MTALILTADADKSATLAERRAEEITRQAGDLRRMADAGEAATLIDLAESALWPADEERIPQLEAWLRRADPVLERLPGHRRELEELRAPAPPLTETGRAREDQAHAADRKDLARLEAGLESAGLKEAETAARERLAAAEEALADPDTDEARRERAARVVRGRK